MEVNCPECQSLLRIADDNAGRQTRCPSCSAVFTADRPSTPAPQPTPAPLTPAPANVGASNPYAPTFTEPEAPRVFSSEWAPRQISIDEVFSKAWAIFKDQWVMICVVMLILSGINFGMQMAQNIIIQILDNVANQAWAVVGTELAIFVLFWLLQMWIQIGQTIVLLDVARGREISLGKLFSGGPFLLHTVLAVIMIGVITGAVAGVFVGIPAVAIGLAMQDGGAAAVAAIVGGVIAIVPTIIVLLMFSQIQQLIIDRGVGAAEALRLSYEITKGNKLTIFLIGFLLLVMGICAVILGLLALCVGVIPAMIGFGGFSSLVLVVMYLSMTGQQMATPQQYVSPGPAA